ncbi:DMT family transporter [Pararhodobacter oceanensis]|uniref:DMT family transporter n=1 Tax=Pararhodobacter oceanensis TaxID=2172121 RepID=UPI001F0BDC7B|nr:EamA family transporter [Pararhodobacter oceanensis]
MSQIASPSRPTLFNWLEIALLGLIWGASFMMVQLSLNGIGPLGISTLRIAIAALILSLLCLIRRLPLPSLRRDRKIWLHAAGMALFSNALPFSLLSWAQLHVTSGFAGITMALVPLFTLVMAHLMLPGERLTLPRLLGFLLGLIGVALLIGSDALHSGGASLEPIARVICIGAALCYAIGSIITRRCPPVDPIAFSTAALLIASVMMLLVTLTVEGVPAQMPPTSALLAILYLGVFPTALATLILVHVIRTAGPTFLTQTNYQVPVWSVIFGTLLLAEPLPAQFIIALALILSGLLVSRIAFRGLSSRPGA